MLCKNCKGAKKLLGMGCLVNDCERCNGTGKEANVENSQDNAEQNGIESAKNSAREANVDSAPWHNVIAKKRHNVIKSRIHKDDEI